MSECKCKALCVCRARKLLQRIMEDQIRRNIVSGGYQPGKPKSGIVDPLPPPKKR